VTQSPQHPAASRGDAPPILADLSLVVPTLGRPVLRRCLAAIRAGDRWPARVIVVDQGSGDEVARLLDQLEAGGIAATHVRSDQRGRSAGLNRGIERVGTELVAITDDDCLAEPDWLRAMHARLHAHPGAAITGRVEAEGDGPVVAVVTEHREVVQRRPSLRFDRLSGGNMGTSRAVLERVGPFDEDARVRTAEDCDWSYRALRAGVAIVYAPEVCVRHLGWRDAGERSEQYRDYALSHGGFYGKHLRRGDGFIAARAALHVGRSARRLLRGLLTGDRERIVHASAYLRGLPLGIVRGLRRRRREP
jgi:GT2 family glycosyltransferase